jgi:hypothetical protein
MEKNSHNARPRVHSHEHTDSLCTRRGFLSVLIPGSILARQVLAQQPGNLAERFRQMSETAERTGLAEPFKGITTDGRVIPGLFPIKSTGISAEPVRNARRATPCLAEC